MSKSGWMVLLVVGWIVAGCSGEPAKTPVKDATPDKEAKAVPVATESPAKEPAAAAPETPAPETPAKASPEGKGGSVPGAMGKALFKAIATPSKSKEQKAADEAPPFRP